MKESFPVRDYISIPISVFLPEDGPLQVVVSAIVKYEAGEVRGQMILSAVRPPGVPLQGHLLAGSPNHKQPWIYYGQPVHGEPDIAAPSSGSPRFADGHPSVLIPWSGQPSGKPTVSELGKEPSSGSPQSGGPSEVGMEPSPGNRAGHPTGASPSVSSPKVMILSEVHSHIDAQGPSGQPGAVVGENTTLNVVIGNDGPLSTSHVKVNVTLLGPSGGLFSCGPRMKWRVSGCGLID